MIIDLPSTTTSQVNKKLVELRESGGAVALGRVLTLVIVTGDGSEVEKSIQAANVASREHPCRVIVVARGLKEAAPRLDAQIRIGGDAGASEVIVLRMPTELAGYVRDTFGTRAAMRETGDGLMEVRITGTARNVRFFALQYGPSGCEVLHPESLRQQLKADAESIAEKYR